MQLVLAMIFGVVAVLTHPLERFPDNGNSLASAVQLTEDFQQDLQEGDFLVANQPVMPDKIAPDVQALVEVVPESRSPQTDTVIISDEECVEPLIDDAIITTIDGSEEYPPESVDVYVERRSPFRVDEENAAHRDFDLRRPFVFIMQKEPIEEKVVISVDLIDDDDDSSSDLEEMGQMSLVKRSSQVDSEDDSNDDGERNFSEKITLDLGMDEQD